MRINREALIKKLTAPTRKHNFKWVGAHRYTGGLYIEYICSECGKRAVKSSMNEDFRYTYGCTGKDN